MEIYSIQLGTQADSPWLAFTPDYPELDVQDSSRLVAVQRVRDTIRWSKLNRQHLAQTLVRERISMADRYGYTVVVDGEEEQS